jgi:hypothetical protein
MLRWVVALDGSSLSPEFLLRRGSSPPWKPLTAPTSMALACHRPQHQQRTHAPQQAASLFDHHVGTGEQDPPAASCRCYIHPPTRRRHQIPIAPAAPPVPNFPRLRALALLDAGRHSAWKGSSCRRPKTCTCSDSCIAAIASYSISSSARARSESATVRPRVLAVLRLITSSYLVGACTGRSAGFSPLRMRSTYLAARRYWSIVFGP